MTKLNVLYEPHIPRFRKYHESIFRSATIYQLKGKCKKNTILRFLKPHIRSWIHWCANEIPESGGFEYDDWVFFR